MREQRSREDRESGRSQKGGDPTSGLGRASTTTSTVTVQVKGQAQVI